MKIIKQAASASKEYPKVCPICGDHFIFCGSKSKAAQRKYCSRECFRKSNLGEGNPRYKGGTTRPDGYRVLSQNGRRILEHRAVMQAHLGRQLLPDETVHHIDENPSNNALDNLRLCQSKGTHNNLHVTTFRSDTHKQCTKCGDVKPRIAFSKNRAVTVGCTDPHDTQCKTCRAAAQKARRKR